MGSYEPQWSNNDTVADSTVCLADFFKHPTRHETLACSSFAVIVVNTDLKGFPKPWFDRIWNNALFRVCADGGANRLHDFYSHHGVLNESAGPHAICGDLDSLDATVASYYHSEKKSEIYSSDCKNTTDLDKCLHLTCSAMVQGGTNGGSAGGACGVSGVTVNVVILADLTAGRLDHFFSLYASIAKLKNSSFFKHPKNNASLGCISILSPGNFTTVLSQGRTAIKLKMCAERATCGLVPFGCPVRVETSGLRWNLSADFQMRFDLGLISSSNSILRLESAHEKRKFDSGSDVSKGGRATILKTSNVTFVGPEEEDSKVDFELLPPLMEFRKIQMGSSSFKAQTNCEIDSRGKIDEIQSVGLVNVVSDGLLIWCAEINMLSYTPDDLRHE